MLSAVGLSTALRVGLGYPAPNSSELLGWGRAIVSELISNGIASFSSGKVTGTCTPGGPLTGGAATNGTLSSVTGASLATRVESEVGYDTISDALQKHCNAIAEHVVDAAILAFAPGTLVGACTNGPATPGSLVGGSGSGGTLSGLSGAILATEIASSMGYDSVSNQLLNFCDGICNYVTGNASISFSSGQVTGICPPGAAPLSNGAATSGFVS